MNLKQSCDLYRLDKDIAKHSKKVFRPISIKNICQASTEALLAAALAFDEEKKQRIATINI
jgi:hypothetical protein